MNETKEIIASGFVVATSAAIFGVGATEADARTDEREWSESNEGAMPALPATAALIAQVKDEGGDIAWDTTDGIACTTEEGGSALSRSG